MTTAPATPQDLFARLEALGIATRTHQHRPVFTVDESRDLRGAIPGVHCKSLYLRDKKEVPWLVVAEEARPLDMKALASVIGSARLSFGSPARLLAQLGVEPGSVTPFALINAPAGSIKVVLDAAVMAAEIANFHPLTNRMTTSIAPADLGRFIRACGHEPRTVDLDPATPKGHGAAQDLARAEGCQAADEGPC
jgi:Ala-tRNA(Pro) deacylase